MQRNLPANYPTLLSFVLSACLYLMILLSFFAIYQKAMEQREVEKYTDDLNSYIDIEAIDIDDTPIPVATNEISESQNKESTKEINPNEVEQTKTALKEIKEAKPKENEKTPEKIEKEEPKEVDINAIIEPKPIPKKQSAKSLFDDVEVKEQTVASKKKSDEKTSTQEKKASSNQIAKVKGEKAAGKSQRTGKYNKFLGGVEKILANLWKTYRANPGENGTIELTINSKGRASVKIVELGYSPEFNQKFRSFADKLQNTQFPIPPDGAFTHKYKMSDILK